MESSNCKFCNSKSKLYLRHKRSGFGSRYTEYQVKCTHCGCSGPIRTSEQEAVRVWENSCGRQKSSSRSGPKG